MMTPKVGAIANLPLTTLALLMRTGWPSNVGIDIHTVAMSNESLRRHARSQGHTMKVGIEKYHLQLTDDEVATLMQIDLHDDFPSGIDGHAVYLANRKPILKLMQSLLERDAIPRRRLAFWRDADLKPGQTKGSRMQMFEKNGNVGDEVYTHPGFKQYLRYFLFGAHLPADAIAEFEDKVGNREWFGGSDIIPLMKKTREIVRKYGLQGEADEFLKLALDAGLNNYNALSVRKAARDASRR
jgi:hypothetical protein